MIDPLRYSQTMKTKKKKGSDRAQVTEEKGDNLFHSGNYEKALEQYRKSQAADPQNSRIYDKLITTHEKVIDVWKDKDFSESLSWTMKKQELENPKLKRVHAQMEPEWKEVSGLIQQMMKDQDEKCETEIIEKIVSYRDKALYPLLEVLLSLKRVQRKILDRKEKT